MIFKKHISILLAFLLLVSNFGLAFNIHYCDNKIASISINVAPTLKQKADECCGIIEQDSKCCNDKIIKAEIKSERIIVKSLSFEPDFVPVGHDSNPIFFDSKVNFTKRDNLSYYCDAHAPPLYLLYSQFTFYC